MAFSTCEFHQAHKVQSNSLVKHLSGLRWECQFQQHWRITCFYMPRKSTTNETKHKAHNSCQFSQKLQTSGFMIFHLFYIVRNYLVLCTQHSQVYISNTITLWYRLSLPCPLLFQLHTLLLVSLHQCAWDIQVAFVKISSCRCSLTDFRGKNNALLGNNLVQTSKMKTSSPVWQSKVVNAARKHCCNDTCSNRGQPSILSPKRTII